jgi:hypothetical protein
MYWLVEPEPGKANSESLPEEMLKSLREFWSSNDEHWLGLKNSVAADVHGIGSVLQRMDEIVRRFEGTASAVVQPLPPGPQNKPVVQREVIALD